MTYKTNHALRLKTLKLALIASLLSVTQVASTASAASTTAASASGDLFAKGPEHFKILNQNGESPQFRVLSDSMSKQALAIAAIGVINAQTEIKPKLPITSYIDLKPQTLTLTTEGKDRVALSMKLNGYDVDLGKTVSKQELLSGKSLEIKYPTTQKDVGLSTVDTSGTLKLHLDPATKNLVLEDVNAKLTFSNPLGDEENEKVRFSGTAKRIR